VFRKDYSFLLRHEFLHNILCSGGTATYYASIIDSEDALKILQTQSVAARELYAIWRQSTDKNDSLKEMMSNLVSYIIRVSDVKQVRGPEIQGVLRDMVKIMESVDAMCAETGKALHMLYFTEGHGEALYKLMKKDEGIRELGLHLDTDNAEYRARLDNARKQVTKNKAAKEKAAKESEKAGRGGGGGGGSGRGRGRGRGSGQQGGWHDPSPYYSRGRGTYVPHGGNHQSGGSGGWHQSGGGNPYNAHNAQFQTQFPPTWGQGNRSRT